MTQATGRPAAQRARSGWSTTRRSIQVVGATLVVLSIGLFVGLAASNWRSMFGDARHVAQNLAAMLAEHAGRTVDVSNVVAEQAIEMTLGRTWDQIAASPETNFKLRILEDRYEYINAIMLVDEGGGSRMTTRAFPSPEISVAAREHFQLQKETDAGLHISPLLRSRMVDELNFVLSRRINGPNGEFRGAVLVILNPEYFQRVYANVQIRYPVTVELFRDDLSLLVRHPRAAREEERAQAGALRLQAAPAWGLVDLAPSDGTGRRLLAYQEVTPSSLYLGVTVAYADITRLWVDAEIQKAIFAAAALGIILLFVTIAAVRCGRETEARAEIEQLNATLEDRVKDRTVTVERLMAELNHRVKNSLQMISGLLNLQARGSDRADVRFQLEEARNRVMMIARIHGRLERQDALSSVKLDGLLRDIVADLSRALTTPDGTAVALDVAAAPLEVTVDKAAPIVLVVNELVTNSVKHSFAGRDAGWIRVTLEADGPAAARLSVEDDGVGLPLEFDPASSGGLGMTLVVGLVQQLEGTLSHGPSERGGARFVVVLPLAAADTAPAA